jgi:hypothetical protein
MYKSDLYIADGVIHRKRLRIEAEGELRQDVVKPGEGGWTRGFEFIEDDEVSAPDEKHMPDKSTQRDAPSGI